MTLGRGSGWEGGGCGEAAVQLSTVLLKFGLGISGQKWLWMF